MSTSKPSDQGAAAAAPAAPIFTSNVPVPSNLNLKGDLCKNWKQWKQIWDAYELVTKLNEQTDRYRVAAFITCIGPEVLTIHNGLPFPNEAARQDMSTILALWNGYCVRKTNIAYERYRFNNRSTRSGRNHRHVRISTSSPR